MLAGFVCGGSPSVLLPKKRRERTTAFFHLPFWCPSSGVERKAGLLSLSVPCPNSEIQEARPSCTLRFVRQSGAGEVGEVGGEGSQIFFHPPFCQPNHGVKEAMPSFILHSGASQPQLPSWQRQSASLPASHLPTLPCTAQPAFESFWECVNHPRQ